MINKNQEQPTVIFFEDGHTYWCGGKKMHSANGYIKQFVPDEFGDEYWIIHRALDTYFGEEYKAARKKLKMQKPPAEEIFPQFISKLKPSEFIRLKREVKETWELNRIKSAYFGTMFHKHMEMQDIITKSVVNPFDGKEYKVQDFDKMNWDNCSFSDNLYELPDGVHLELLVFNLDICIAGQADRVFIETIGKKRYVDIDDHKTNKDKPSKSGALGYGPLNKIPVGGDYWKHALQMSSYAWMLEQFGFIPRKLGFTWYKNYDPKTALLMEVPYLKKEVEGIFKNNC